MDGTAGNDSPPPRSTILGSFLGRGRPRNSSQSHIDVPSPNPNFSHPIPANSHIPRELSPSPPNAHANPPSPAFGNNPMTFGVPAGNTTGRRNARHTGPPPVQTALALQTAGSGAPPSASGGGGLSLGHMLRRRRSAGNVNAGVPPTPVQGVPVLPTTGSRASAIFGQAPAEHAPAPPPHNNHGAHGGTHRIRLVPHLDSRRSLRFDPIARDLKPGEPALRIGRFTDRSGLGLAAVNALSTNKIAFKSKVVSRAHAEVWVEHDGGGTRFLIRDTKSSSGTFLNHVRLSPANAESRPHPLKDGDILQLGVDYQGGAEDIYKSVKIRVEIGREWQSGVNAFKCVCVSFCFLFFSFLFCFFRCAFVFSSDG
ncbi:SMAD/FHA domain-containing protein [Mycena galopus ATCC 62051]|nr:SMAD/FHA domain-containing protein [Mycena galopus ATCC 62051]